jgi:CBS domain-containing protein
MQIGIVMTPGIAWIPSDDTVRHAASLMRGASVGALAVFEGDLLAGIITERDLVPIVADALDAGSITVAERMTPDPAVAFPQEDSTVVAGRMAELGVRHLPVVDHGRLVGMISARDLLIVEATPPVPRGEPRFQG